MGPTDLELPAVKAASPGMSPSTFLHTKTHPLGAGWGDGSLVKALAESGPWSSLLSGGSQLPVTLGLRESYASGSEGTCVHHMHPSTHTLKHSKIKPKFFTLY